MNYKISKTKKAFSLMELLIVIAIIMIMTGVLFANRNNGKESAEVEGATREIAAQIRALQNESLNGRKFASGNATRFKFSNGNETTYKLEYYSSEYPSGPAVGDLSVDISAKKVKFGGFYDFSFFSPDGKISPSGSNINIEIKSKNNGSIVNCILISQNGSIEEIKAACP